MTGKWKFSDYEIADEGGEYRIRPALGAVLQPFDPWSIYEEANRVGAVKPYEELLRAMYLIDKDDDVSHALGFCRKFGLLGILPLRYPGMPLHGFDDVGHFLPAGWRHTDGGDDEVFWSQYREPVDFWRSAAAHLGECISGGNAETLNKYLLTNGTIVEQRGKAVRLVPRYTSLLSALAMMAAQDRAGGGRVVHCAACGIPFVTSAYQAKYCNLRCQWREVKRRGTNRKKGAR